MASKVKKTTPGTRPPIIDPLEREYMEMLRKNRPKMYRAMKREGVLEQMAASAAENYRDMVATMMENGEWAGHAQSMAARSFLILPLERDVPDLANNPFELP